MYKIMNYVKMDKEYLYDQYFRIVENPKKYTSITRKKMLEEIVKQYTPQYIVDICTCKELKFLEKVVKNEQVTNSVDYAFEIEAVSNKFLYNLESGLVQEVEENIKEALKIVDYKQKKETDRFLAILIGCVQSQGFVFETMLQAFCAALQNAFDFDTESFAYTNPLFRYYVYFEAEFKLRGGKETVVYVYQDLFEYMYEIYYGRFDYEMVTPKFLSPEAYESIFYTGFDCTNKIVSRFVNTLKKSVKDPFEYHMKKSLVLYNVNFLDGGIVDYGIDQISDLLELDEKLSKLFKKAEQEFPRPLLSGLSTREYREYEEKMARVEQFRASNVKQLHATLDEKDAKLFYKYYFSILDFTNKKFDVIPGFEFDGMYVDQNQMVKIIDVFWDNKESVLDEYCKKNPLKLTNRGLNIIRNFKYGFRGEFAIVHFEEKYTVFDNEEVLYMVKGLYDNIDQIIHADSLPMTVKTSLLPFADSIIYDSIIMEYPISIGPNMAEKFEERYRTAQKIYRLTPEKNH